MRGLVQKPMLGDECMSDGTNPQERNNVVKFLFNEGSGDIVNDLSGNGRKAAATGATGEISWQAGPDGSCVDFVGDTQAGFQFNQITLGATDKWTLVWKCQTDGDASEAIMLGLDSNTNDYIWLQDGVNKIRFKNTAGGDYYFTSMPSFLIWHTFVLVAKGDGNLHLYVDGILHETGAIATSFKFNNIGCGYNSDTYTYDGRISHVNLYGRDLSASEIAQVYREPFCDLGPRRLFYAPAAAGAGSPLLQMNHFNGGMAA